MSMHTPAAKEPASPPTRRWAMLLIPVAAFGLGIGATFATARSRPDPYRGVYRQEAVEVTATVAGKLVALDSSHGQEVQPGDKLATLESDAFTAQLKSLGQQRDDLQRRLVEATAAAAMQTALQIDELEKQRLETRLRYADLLRARFDVQLRKEALQKNAAGPPVARSRSRIMPVSAETDSAQRQLAIADAVNEEQVLSAQLTLCEERLAQIESLRNEIPGQVERSLGLEQLKSDLAAIEESLAEAQAGESAATVASPAYGRVGIYRHQVGDQVARGETLVEVFDAERPYILLTVPISELSTLSPGRKVRIEFEGITTRKALAGVVDDVASEAERHADAAMAPGSAVAQIRITPIGRLWPTPPPGATAIVHLDDVPQTH